MDLQTVAGWITILSFLLGLLGSVRPKIDPERSTSWLRAKISEVAEIARRYSSALLFLLSVSGAAFVSSTISEKRADELAGAISTTHEQLSQSIDRSSKVVYFALGGGV